MNEMTSFALLGKNGLVYAHILQTKNLQMKIHTHTCIHLHTWSKKKLLNGKAIATHTYSHARTQCATVAGFWYDGGPMIHSLLLLAVVVAAAAAAAAVIALENMQDIRFTEWKCP